jgi:hypothetical protein
MNFEDKLASLFHSLSENVQPPNTSQDYLFFDYIEFYAFFYGDEVYKTELLDYFSDCNVNILKYVNEDDTGIRDEDDNRRETAINTIFSCLEYRSSLLGEYYPYDINHNSIELKSELSVGNKAYIVLLICSMLGKFSEFQSDLTSEFEEIICIVLEKMFPESVIKSFGKNSDYEGTAQEKIRNLAIDLNIMTRKHEILKVRGNQEKGLDLIVWQPFKDTVPNMSISLVQCACGKQWTSKFDDAKTYEAYFDCYQSVINYIFASSYALLCHNEFSKNDEIVKSGSIFLDRLRIINLIDGLDISDRAEVSFKLVDELIPHTINF